MADVSVEFGAKDTGLEQTLKTVQAQLTSLEEEVKSGTLSFDELQQTMRKIGQAEKVQDQLQGMAEGMTDAGDAASGAAPQIDDSADSMDEVGTSATDAGEKSEMGFVQMAAAVAVGQAAVELAMGAIKGAIDGVVGMFDRFGEALDKGAELDILSTRTGVASGELSRLGRALENTGASSDMLGPIFDKMNRALANSGEEGGRAGDALGKLGINIDHLKTLSPDQQFELIGKSLSNVADRSERVDIAMDIFGRGSGSRLLRLFEDYEGTMAQVDRQLGVFPSIMNAMSASFEAASTEMNAAKEKMVEFATGIISRVMPAVEAIATGLASIDAAALGQKLADAFTGGVEAMKGFQSAVDAFKTGNIEGALSLLWDSIKLQAKMTADEIYRNLIAAFQTAGTFIAEIFSPSGALLSTIASSFEMLGKKMASGIQRDLAGVMESLPMGIGDAAALALNKMANESNTAANKISDSLVGAGGRIADQFTKAGAALPKTFSEKYSAIPPLFADLNEQAAALAEKQEEVAKAAENLPPALTSANNSAVALAGNSLLFSQNIQSGSNAASSAKSSLDALAGSAGSLKTETSGAATNLQTVGQMADEITQKKMDQGARDLNAEIKGVQSEYQALMQSLGIQVAPNVSLEGIISDLGLTSQGLDSTDIKLEQVKRSLDALSQTPVADLTPALDEMGASNKITEIGGILRENFQGLDVTPYIDREAIGEGVASTKDTIESALKEFKAKVTLDPQIQDGVEQIKQTLDSEFSDPTKLNLDGDDSISQVRQSAESDFAESIPLNLDGDDSISQVRQSAESDFKNPIPLNLNIDESLSSAINKIEGERPQITAEVDQASLDNVVAQMQAEITNEFTGGEGGLGGDATGGQGGDGGLGGDANADVTSLVTLLQPWETIISAIRDRLPITALA